MKKLLFLFTTAFVLCSFAASCDKEATVDLPDFEGMISAKNIIVTPNPLEVIDGIVPVSIAINVPAGFTYPTASVNLSAILAWNGGTVQASRHGGFQGTELPNIGGTVISYETGGKVSMGALFSYEPYLAKSELFVQFDVLYLGQHSVFRVKVADGVITPAKPGE